MLFYFCKIDYNRFTYIFSTYGNSTDDCGPEPLLPPEAGEKRKQIRILIWKRHLFILSPDAEAVKGLIS